ncbi:PHP domain-containing protein [Fusibacter sp. 3D3]|uniref:PHP domain-containing protein n=1 Tax=Fusibacter sp. 3D3 TaxID=1048380 RepID=UPI0008539A83|nr:PHP domain-containing protein [Fusibacter sp. 3D3]GAU76841.1 predicted metal-dependent phosphoesterases [Fusibacter sp. 3D3]
MKKKYVDLHIHTTASDGTLTPEELIIEIKANDIELFSVTDHDCMDNVIEMMTIAKREGIAFIPGIELSATFMDRELHLLTYGIDPLDTRFLERVAKNRSIREIHNRAVIEYVSQKHEAISLKGYENFVRDPSLGGWQAENYLFTMSVTKSLTDFFAIIEEMGLKLIFDPIEEVLPELVAMGYTVVLAHPPAYFKGDFISKEILNELKALGLSGIECYSPYYRETLDYEYYKDYCLKNNLLITCGSDYHGQFIPSRKLATPKVTSREISFEALLKLARY